MNNLSQHKGLKALTPFIFRYKVRIAWIGLAMGVGVLMQLPAPLITMYVVDNLIAREKLSVVGWLCLLLIFTLTARSALSIVETFLNNALRLRIVFDVKTKLYDRLLRMALDRFHRLQTGYLISRVAGDVEGIQSLFAPTLFAVLRNLSVFIVGLVMIYWLNLKLAVVVTALLPVYVVALFAFNGRVRCAADANREAYAQVYKFLQEHITGVAVTKAFACERYDVLQMVRTLKTAIRGEFRIGLLGAMSMVNSNWVASLGPIMLLWLGIIEIANNRFTLGGLIAFNSFLAYLIGPLSSLAGLNVSIQNSIACAKRVAEFLTEPMELHTMGGVAPARLLTGNIEFKNLYFSYMQGGPAVLKNVSFTIATGTCVALVGKSGAGKSTIASLLLRFYDYNKGEILLDNRPLGRYNPRSLRKQIGLVSQDTFLFGYTVLENIRLGRLNASDEEVIEAAKAAYAHDFIMKLPEQYATRLGERGALISGGERQRIALARVFLKNPRIVILDEATSSLDAESEYYVRMALHKLRASCTALVITHRLSFIADADQIIIIDNGSVNGIGTHQSLYENNELYRHLCDEQQVGKNEPQTREVRL